MIYHQRLRWHRPINCSPHTLLFHLSTVQQYQRETSIAPTCFTLFNTIWSLPPLSNILVSFSSGVLPLPFGQAQLPRDGKSVNVCVFENHFDAASLSIGIWGWYFESPQWVQSSSWCSSFDMGPKGWDQKREVWTRQNHNNLHPLRQKANTKRLFPQLQQTAHAWATHLATKNIFAHR